MFLLKERESEREIREQRTSRHPEGHRNSEMTGLLPSLPWVAPWPWLVKPNFHPKPL